MSDTLSSSVLVLGTTFIPLFVGLYIPRLSSKHGTHSFLAAVAAGIVFWFFLDVMNDAALLKVNQGFTGGLPHALLASSFALGLLTLFAIEKLSVRHVSISDFFKAGESSLGPIHRGLLAVAGMVALGIGFHSLAEGFAVGTASASSADLIEAIGGPGAGLAYVFHKLLEGFVVGVVARLVSARIADLTLLGLIVGVPTMLGFAAGISVEVETTYFFALGAAGAVYAECLLIPRALSERRSLAAAGLPVGFYLMYVAGLFHG